jgi:antitoxin VapB
VSILTEGSTGYTVTISQVETPVTKTKLFQSNRSQALRLPKDVAFPATVRDVAIFRDGARRVVVPANAVWDDFFDCPGIDIGERMQPPYPEREAF